MKRIRTVEKSAKSLIRKLILNVLVGIESHNE